jgi:RNA-binding protein
MNNPQEKISLTIDEKRELKKKAHHLKPVVTLGKKGVSEALINELLQALLAHELIKLQVMPERKRELAEDLQAILRETNSEHIDTIGNVIILYKKRENSQE